MSTSIMESIPRCNGKNMLTNGGAEAGTSTSGWYGSTYSTTTSFYACGMGSNIRCPRNVSPRTRTYAFGGVRTSTTTTTTTTISSSHAHNLTCELTYHAGFDLSNTG